MALVQVAMALNAHHRPTALDSLTDREHQVLAGVARGLTNAAIARRLGLTPNTVKTYLQSAMRKLGVSNRAEAVARCFALSPLPPVADQRSEVEQLGSSAPGVT